MFSLKKKRLQGDMTASEVDEAELFRVMAEYMEVADFNWTRKFS